MTTNFHDYNTPPKFQENWHIALNENFEQLDHDVPVIDSEANRPSVPPTNTQFVSTDGRTLSVFRGESAGWSTIAGRGSKQNPLDSGPYTRAMFQKTTLASDETLTIPDGYGMTVPNEYHMEGDLTIEDGGTFKVM